MTSPAGAEASQVLIGELREELAALPVVEAGNALSLVNTLSHMSGVQADTVASAVYVLLSVLLDACAVFFLLAGSPVRESRKEPVVMSEPVSEPVQEELIDSETPDLTVPYKAIFDGICKLSVRSIRNHYQVGTRGAYDIINKLQSQGLIKKDDTTNRYQLTESAIEKVRV